MLVRALAVSACVVLPLFAAEVWGGFRLALSNDALSVIAASEQPLSVRSPVGPWAMLLVLAWFGMAYWRRRITWWESPLVVAGGAAILLRVGNAWLYGALMLAPLARQLLWLRPRPVTLALASALGLAVAAFTLVTTRPPNLPAAAEQAVVAAAHDGSVFANWRWAPSLQHELGSPTRVLAGGGLASETPMFWIHYLRIAQGHELWAQDLRDLEVDVVVLDAVDQDRPAANLVRQSNQWHVTYEADGVLVAERARP